MSQEGFLAEAIQKIMDLSDPAITKINNINYSSDELVRIDKPLPLKLNCSTLDAIVGYFNITYEENPEDAALEVFIHVVCNGLVEVRESQLTDGYLRSTFISATPAISEIFPYSNWIPLEDFIVKIQTHFVHDETVSKIVRLLSNIKEEKVFQSMDDGVSQSVVAKVGLTMAERVDIPNPVILRPYRTFLEVEQPESEFILRLRLGSQPGKGMEVSLHTAGCGLWKLQAIKNIRDYLHDKLPHIKIMA